MFRHYLKIAFRNIRKYKNQTLISVIGLALGFTCFALAMLWMQYEISYDKFHRDAHQIYVVYQPGTFSSKDLNKSTGSLMPAFLKETFPEISDAAAILPEWSGRTIEIDATEHSAFLVAIDSSFFRMFDIQIIDGNRDFLIPLNNKVAITQQKAREWFGNESPIGKELVSYGTTKTICAVVAEWNRPSNYRFDVIESLRMGFSWAFRGGENTLIKLSPETNIDAFKKKLAEFNTEIGTDYGAHKISNLTLLSLTEMRYKDSNIGREVKFQHIVYFATAGLLVVFCCLFNYLTLFVSRFRIRQKELALRMVCGASGRSLFGLLSTEFLLTMIFSFLLGLACVQLILPSFRKLAEIQSNTTSIYGQLIGYILGVILLSFLFFLLILFFFRKKALNASIRKRRSNFFRYASIVSQLVISVGFIFCTSVLLKQIYYLHNTSDLGFTYKNSATISVSQADIALLSSQLREIPEITDILMLGSNQPLFPLRGRSTVNISNWDDMTPESERISISMHRNFSGHIVEFYGIQLLEGEWLNENDSINVLINEAAVKAFGWSDPIGKSFGFNDNSNSKGYKVKGVIKNVYNHLPTTPPSPSLYAQKGFGGAMISVNGGTIPIKYSEGAWDACKARIESLLEKEYKNAIYKNITQVEDVYEKMFVSETALMKLLGFVSLICIVICLFGFFSIVSQTCEERRKEIAIRKINGATIRDILIIFFREFMTLLGLGTLVAFSLGYYIMKRWLEQYNLQTTIPLWLYVTILLALVVIIVSSVGWQVYKSSVASPAEVVKSE